MPNLVFYWFQPKLLPYYSTFQRITTFLRFAKYMYIVYLTNINFYYLIHRIRLSCFKSSDRNTRKSSEGSRISSPPTSPKSNPRKECANSPKTLLNSLSKRSKINAPLLRTNSLNRTKSKSSAIVCHLNTKNKKVSNNPMANF